MATLPNTANGTDLSEFTLEVQPSYTYRLDIDRSRITGMTDEREALLQAVYLILSTERYMYVIYSRRYGVELSDIIGKDRDYAICEIKRCISESLLQDDRITDIVDWDFEESRDTVTASFTVKTIFGDISVKKEVEV